MEDVEEKWALYQISAHKGYNKANEYHLKMKTEAKALIKAQDRLAAVQAREHAKMDRRLARQNAKRALNAAFQKALQNSPCNRRRTAGREDAGAESLASGDTTGGWPLR